MGMVVRTNTMALNAYRQLGMNNSAVAKSLEKLSSGFRINRAGDDAAGLAISEKMKAQITGLETASANAQDGISLIQTAEGNLTEVHSMLNRMVELATKSANGTYTSTERDALQDEVDALLDEIDRISQSANFNGTNLLDGTMGLNQKAFAIDSNPVKAQDGADLTSKLTITKANPEDETWHLGGASVSRQDPSFVVDFSGLSFSKGDTADTFHDITVAVAGVTMKVATTGTTGTLDGTADADATAIRDAIFANNANWTGKTANTTVTADASTTYVDIQGAVFKATKDGSTGIKFEYVGVAAANDKAPDATALTDTIADNINGQVGSAPVITMTAATNGGKDDVPDFHDTVNVKQAVAAVDGKRAGTDVQIGTDLAQIGATITIDDKTYTVVSKKDGETVGENELNVGTDLDLTDATDKATAIHRMVDQLSFKSTTNFRIESAGNDKIHIDQLTTSTNVYDTEAKLKAVVSAKGPSTSEAVKLTVTDSEIVNGDAITVGDKTYKFVEKLSGNAPTNTTEILKSKGTTGLIDALKNDGFTVNGTGPLEISKAGADKAPFIVGGGLTLQIGDTADSFNKMTVAVANMSAKGLGLDGLSIKTENLSSDAIDKIKTAINTVSTARAGMGALQNRLEHTINNLDVAVENLSAANSRIRDTDMAKEMMNYTKMNVLVQSAQAMLAQANQQPQSVLQLLQ